MSGRRLLLLLSRRKCPSTSTSCCIWSRVGAVSVNPIIKNAQSLKQPPMAISHSVSFLLLLFATMAMAEKKARLHFYLQGTVTGPNATLVTVAKTTPNATLFNFGSVSVLDDLLTEGPDRASNPVGRCQGLVAQAQLSGPPASVAVENFVFTSGKFNGSSLAMVGRVDPITGTFELAVVGGSGKFRLARGYALAKFLGINTTAGTSLVEYDVYVLRESFKGF